MVDITAAEAHEVNLTKRKRGGTQEDDNLDYNPPVDSHDVDSKEDNGDEQDEIEESASAHKRRRITAPESDQMLEPVSQQQPQPQLQPQHSVQKGDQSAVQSLSPPKTPLQLSEQLPPPETIARLEQEENEVVDILSAPIRDSSVPPFLPESPLVKAPSPPKRRRNVRTRASPPAEKSSEPPTPLAKRTRRGGRYGCRRVHCSSLVCVLPRAQLRCEVRFSVGL